ncbi:MAG: hypothetical protein FWG96_06585 [Methanomassiliicoccaceae archaeon]|nr:hypothetical protein [Methanomassiliicoccaceae archaeon]
MNVKIILLVSVLITFSGMSVIAFDDVSDGADPADAITDGTGDAEPVKYIAALGYAPALTVAMVGEIDKIIAVTTYSTYEYTKDERLKDLHAKDVGSIYSAINNDYVLTWLLQWAEANNVDKNDIGIILTGYPNAIVLGNVLSSFGFNNVLAYNNITEWDDIIDCVKKISIMATGEISSVVEDMELVKATIDKGLEGITEKRKGLAVWYSTANGEYQVNNTGSISVSLIEAAGGINIAYNPSISGQRYGDVTTVIQMAEANPDMVIFIANQSVSNFRSAALPQNSDVTVIAVNPNWNNYAPDAAEGLWAFASALYPDLFEGDVQIIDDEQSNPDLLLYAAAGIMVTMVIIGLAYFFMRKP